MKYQQAPCYLGVLNKELPQIRICDGRNNCIHHAGVVLALHTTDGLPEVRQLPLKLLTVLRFRLVQRLFALNKVPPKVSPESGNNVISSLINPNCEDSRFLVLIGSKLVGSHWETSLFFCYINIIPFFLLLCQSFC